MFGTAFPAAVQCVCALAVGALAFATAPADDDAPAHFAQLPQFDTSPRENPLTEAGAELGRALFYDARLSANGTTSCASCHDPAFAFTDPRRLSVGFDGKQTDRNSMSLIELRYQRAGLFWDERGDALEDVVLVPLYSHVEMGMDRDSLLAAIRSEPRYASLFDAAFGTTEPSERDVARALSQFIRSIPTGRSKYDECAADAASFEADFAGFTASENLGKRLFAAECASCHSLGTNEHRAIFSMFRSLNNGIDADDTATDGGRADVSFNPTELGLFKASSMRSVELTAPYMHDGRFETLEEVIEHYSTGVTRHPNVGAVERMNFTEEEKAALVDFLCTLTDTELANDPSVSDPWADAAASTSNDGVRAAEASAPAAESTAEPALGVAARTAEIVAAARTTAAQPPSPATARLAQLDRDSDGGLAPDELDPLAAHLAETLAVARLRAPRDPDEDGERRFGRRGFRGPGGEPDPAADFDGDGEVSTDEARFHRSVVRYIELGDGGRGDVILDRVVANAPECLGDREALRVSLRDAKAVLKDEVSARNAATMWRLHEVLGTADTDRFVDLVVGAFAEPPARNVAASATADSARERLMEFDADDDGRLAGAELRELARQLDALPGGLDAGVPAAPTMDGFAERILAFDRDGDGAVSVAELPERMAEFAREGDVDESGTLTLEEARAHLVTAAFRRILDEGVYIGGAFGNTLEHHRDQLGELGLEPDVLARAEAVMVEHSRALDAATRRASEAELVRLRALGRGDVD